MEKVRSGSLLSWMRQLAWPAATSCLIWAEWELAAPGAKSAMMRSASRRSLSSPEDGAVVKLKASPRRSAALELELIPLTPPAAAASACEREVAGFGPADVHDIGGFVGIGENADAVAAEEEGAVLGIVGLFGEDQAGGFAIAGEGQAHGLVFKAGEANGGLAGEQGDRRGCGGGDDAEGAGPVDVRRMCARQGRGIRGGRRGFGGGAA